MIRLIKTFKNLIRLEYKKLVGKLILIELCLLVVNKENELMKKTDK